MRNHLQWTMIEDHTEKVEAQRFSSEMSKFLRFYRSVCSDNVVSPTAMMGTRIGYLRTI